MSTQEAHDAAVRRALANVRRKADNLISAVIDAELALDEGHAPMPLADSVLQVEPTATADSMAEGGWVRLPGSPRWRQVKRVHRCSIRCRRIDFDTYAGDRDGTYVHVDPATTYPFLTDEQFQADCDAEQRDHPLQQARDFGRDAA